MSAQWTWQEYPAYPNYAATFTKTYQVSNFTKKSESKHTKTQEQRTSMNSLIPFVSSLSLSVTSDSLGYTLVNYGASRYDVWPAEEARGLSQESQDKWSACHVRMKVRPWHDAQGCGKSVHWMNASWAGVMPGTWTHSTSKQSTPKRQILMNPQQSMGPEQK